MSDMKAKIELDVAVENAQSINALADQLGDVSKVLEGELRQAAQRAAEQLRELAQQDAAITTFRDLQADTAKSAQALKAAERELANYKAQLGEGALATREQADALARLGAAARTAGTAGAQMVRTLI